MNKFIDPTKENPDDYLIIRGDDNGTKNYYKEVDGRLIHHRKFGPAIIYKDGSEDWYFNGVFHRIGGPSRIRIYDDEKIYEMYHKHGRFHNLNGPAYTNFKSGQVEYWVEGKRHRLDGPASFFSQSGDYEYWVDGMRHRIDGPAIRTVVDGYVIIEWRENGNLLKEIAYRLDIHTKEYYDNKSWNE